MSTESDSEFYTEGIYSNYGSGDDNEFNEEDIQAELAGGDRATGGPVEVEPQVDVETPVEVKRPAEVIRKQNITGTRSQRHRRSHITLGKKTIV